MHKLISESVDEQNHEYENALLEVCYNFPQMNHVDLVEVGGNHDGLLAKEMRSRGGTVEMWNRCDYNLSTLKGYQSAVNRLSEIRPHHLLLSPPSSSYHSINHCELSPHKRDHNIKQLKWCRQIWCNQVKLALLQLELGGHVHLSHPEQSTTWQAMSHEDPHTQELLRRTQHVSFDLCSDGFTDPQGHLIKKELRIQTSDSNMANLFNHGCQGNHAHSKIE